MILLNENGIKTTQFAFFIVVIDNYIIFVSNLS